MPRDIAPEIARITLPATPPTQAPLVVIYAASRPARNNNNNNDRLHTLVANVAVPSFGEKYIPVHVLVGDFFTRIATSAMLASPGVGRFITAATRTLLPPLPANAAAAAADDDDDGGHVAKATCIDDTVWDIATAAAAGGGGASTLWNAYLDTLLTRVLTAEGVFAVEGITVRFETRRMRAFFLELLEFMRDNRTDAASMRPIVNSASTAFSDPPTFSDEIWDLLLRDHIGPDKLPQQTLERMSRAQMTAVADDLAAWLRTHRMRDRMAGAAAIRDSLVRFITDALPPPASRTSATDVPGGFLLFASDDDILAEAARVRDAPDLAFKQPFAVATTTAAYGRGTGWGVGMLDGFTFSLYVPVMLTVAAMRDSRGGGVRPPRATQRRTDRALDTLYGVNPNDNDAATDPHHRRLAFVTEALAVTLSMFHTYAESVIPGAADIQIPEDMLAGDSIRFVIPRAQQQQTAAAAAPTITLGHSRRDRTQLVQRILGGVGAPPQKIKFIMGHVRTVARAMAARVFLFPDPDARYMGGPSHPLTGFTMDRARAQAATHEHQRPVPYGEALGTITGMGPAALQLSVAL